MQPDIEYQIERNKQRTTVLVLATVINAMTVAFPLSLALSSPLPALIILLTLAIWIAVTYRLFTHVILRGLAVRTLTTRERYRLLPRLDGIVQRLGIAPPSVLIEAEDRPNALAFGAGATSMIIVTRGLLHMMNDDELEGVLAHECSHIANHDTEIVALTAALLGWAIATAFVITLITKVMLTWGIEMVVGNGPQERDIVDILVGMIVGILLVALAFMTWIGIRFWVLIAELTHFAISREREWLADSVAVITTGKPLSLASALEKAAALEPALVSHGDSWTESLTIFGRARRRWWGELFDTHPDIQARITRLRAYASH